MVLDFKTLDLLLLDFWSSSRYLNILLKGNELFGVLPHQVTRAPGYWNMCPEFVNMSNGEIATTAK